MKDHYVIYGGELSLFTRKLEAACIFYGLPFELRSKNLNDPAQIEARSGTHQVPVLHTPENWMIGDTTPIMHLLDERYPARRMFPEGSSGLLVQAREEYFDEWVARTMVHYRWHYPESAEFASLKMSEGNAEIAARVRNWGPRACRATGTDSEVQRQAAEDEYQRIVEAAERQLSKTRYLLGDRPTAVDCIVLGGLRAHTLMDPDPKRIYSDYAEVVAFSEGARDSWDGSGEIDFGRPTDFAELIAREMVTTYQPYIKANRDAQHAKAKAFHATIYGEEVSYLSRPYPEQSRLMITGRWAGLSEQARQRTTDWLEQREITVFSGS